LITSFLKLFYPIQTQPKGYHIPVKFSLINSKSQSLNHQWQQPEEVGLEVTPQVVLEEQAVKYHPQNLC
jgi:hypothetical protein